MKLGAQLYSVRDNVQNAQDFRTTLQKLKAMGYENVQASGIGPIAAEDLRDISAELDMPIVCTHIAYDRILNDTDAVIREHKIFNCPVIGIGSMPKELRDSQEGLEAFLRAMDTPVKKIMDAGLRFSYHNHQFEFVVPTGGKQMIFDTMLERCPDWLFLLDTCWVEYAGQSCVEYIEKIGGKRLTNVHFKDVAHHDPADPQEILGSKISRFIRTPGQGRLDFKAIYEACAKVGVENVLVEQDNAPKTPDPFAEMEFAFKHLRPIIR
jgi:sugar phosphate isomerase/epimerase